MNKKKYLLTIRLNVDDVASIDVEAHCNTVVQYASQAIGPALNALVFVIPVREEETKLSLVDLEKMTVVYL